MEQKLLDEMLKKFKAAGQDALIMNHYELADFMNTNHNYKKSVDAWREFLKEPIVQEYIRSEFAIISESNTRKIIAAVDADDKSVGRAQLINAMLSANEKTSNKREGNIIIYSYILPNEQQSKAPNTEIIKRDPFKGGKNGD